MLSAWVCERVVYVGVSPWGVVHKLLASGTQAASEFDCIAGQDSMSYPMGRPRGLPTTYAQGMAMWKTMQEEAAQGAASSLETSFQFPALSTDTTQMHSSSIASSSIAPLCHSSLASPSPYCMLDHHSVHTLGAPAPYSTHNDSAHTLSPPSRTATPDSKSSGGKRTAATRSRDVTETCEICNQCLTGDHFYLRSLQCIVCQKAINSVTRTVKDAPRSDAKRHYEEAISTLSVDQHSHLEAHRDYLRCDAEQRLRIQFANGVLRPKSKPAMKKVQQIKASVPKKAGKQNKVSVPKKEGKLAPAKVFSYKAPGTVSPKTQGSHPTAVYAHTAGSFDCMYIHGTSERIHFPLACLIKACEMLLN